MSDAFAARFRERAAAGAVLSFADFMDLALFDRQLGYYAAARERVGKSAGTDFVTASTFSAAFGPLVAGAARELLGLEDPAEYTFVEIGAEPGRSVLDGVSHGFGAVQTIRVGDSLKIPTRAVVFSNELLDAQPFHRLIWSDGGWREQGVRLGDHGFEWTPLAEWSAEVAAFAVGGLGPPEGGDGYILDLPLRAASLAREIVQDGWTGLFLAFDYGHPWGRLLADFPQGTGRAYSQHRLVPDLLAQPGQQDLTCHICWDWIEAALRSAGFSGLRRQSQEQFFVHHGRSAIEAIMISDPNPLSKARSQLRELLHPALMGQRFEVLAAVRP